MPNPNIDILDPIIPNPISISSPENCRHCAVELPSIILNDVTECPDCGTLNIKEVRRRQKSPSRNILESLESSNHNGTYNIFKNSDGSFSCNCLSFLFQRGVKNDVGYSTCKHTRKYILSISNTYRQVRSKNPSTWQIAILKRLGLGRVDYLTNTQAYFILNDLLTKQGASYGEYESLLLNHPTVSLLPLNPFGVEFEGYIANNVGISGLDNKLKNAGVNVISTDSYYTSLSNSFYIARDGSITDQPDFTGIELKTPKLFGVEGFKEIKNVLNTWNSAGSHINAKCGTHVHIDAWNLRRNHLRNLAILWAKIEKSVLVVE